MRNSSSFALGLVTWWKMQKWSKDNYIGFIDESGDMREGEPHVVGGLVFLKSHFNAIDNVARTLMSMTPPQPARQRGKQSKWPKAEMLPEAGLDLYSQALENRGVLFARVTKYCDTEPRVQAALDMSNAVALYLDPLVKHLALADQLDLRVQLALKHFQDEANRHPFYFQMVKEWLKQVARHFYGARCYPLLSLCFDFKFQWASRDLLNLLVRGQFHTTFADVVDFRLEQVFGLASAYDFVARIGTDPKEPCLYLADIYAHANKRVAIGNDPGGRYRRFLDALGPVTEV